jgi:hypothetical protein
LTVGILTTAGAVFSQWRWGLAGLFVAGGLIFGWTVADWRAKAAQAADLKILLRNEMERRVAADAARLAADKAAIAAQTRLTEKEAEIGRRTKEVIKRIVVHVPDRRDCDLGEPAVGLLNRARAGLDPLPDAAPEPADGRGAARPGPDPAGAPVATTGN